MQRRRLLQLGVGAAAVLAVAGGGVALVRPGLQGGRLSGGSRQVFAAVAQAVLDGALPADAAARQRAMAGHLDRVQQTIDGLPPATRDELSMLLALLGSAPGRIALAGLRTDWHDAGVAEVQTAMLGMRDSSLALRQQAFLALRELTNAAYFSDPSTWSLLGYPGPNAV
jgi:hypothetical protein